jgi:LysM repeat protein
MIIRVVALALFVGVMANAGIAKEPDQKRKLVYKTRQGDTLVLIAKRFAVKEERLEKMNPAVDFRKLRVGQPIKVGPSA